VLARRAVDGTRRDGVPAPPMQWRDIYAHGRRHVVGDVNFFAATG
jgi:hypothetical protein